MIEALIRQSVGCLAADPDHLPIVFRGKHIVPEPRLDGRVSGDAPLDRRSELNRVHRNFRRVEGAERCLRIERLLPLARRTSAGAAPRSRHRNTLALARWPRPQAERGRWQYTP